MAHKVRTQKKRIPVIVKRTTECKNFASFRRRKSGTRPNHANTCQSAEGKARSSNPREMAERQRYRVKVNPFFSKV